MPVHGEVVLSLTRLNRLGPVDHEAAQVTAGAGVTLQQVADADPGLDLPILIASRDSILMAHAGLAPPLRVPAEAYLLLEASGPGAFGDLADVIGDREAAVAESAADRARLWSYRERHPEAAGFLGVPVKLDVSVPAAQWVRLASSAAAVVADVDPGAQVIIFGHIADGNVHVNIVPAGVADGRHEDAVFRFVASLGGSISAEHGIGVLKAPWLPLARTDAERALFARIRSALDAAGTEPERSPALIRYRGAFPRKRDSCRLISRERARAGGGGSPSSASSRRPARRLPRRWAGCPGRRRSASGRSWPPRTAGSAGPRRCNRS